MTLAMHARRPARALAVSVSVSLLASLGGVLLLACNSLLDFGAYGFDGGADAASFDARGGEAGADAGMDSCPASPQSKTQLESACTSSACEPFDNASRNTLCAEAGTVCPSAPVADAGAPKEGGGADAGDAGDASDGAGLPYPSCFSLTQGPAGGSLPSTVVFATGSTAIQPYVARVAQVLESLSIETVVYLGAGSCFGIDAMLDPQSNPLRSIGATATYYDPALDGNGNVQQGTCAVDDSSRLADLGISDVFPTTCVPALISQGGLPNNLHDFYGPVQTMEMVVPASSPETSISSQAAYMVWGFGSASGVSPWTDEAFLLQRSASSGTQNMIAAAIGLPAAQWHGVSEKTSGAVLAALRNVADGKGIDGGATSDPAAARKALGILASDVADGNRQFIKPLAFQDVGEPCGWYPDSTASSFDKANVRDGHYPIWGPSHLVAYADANGNETNAAVKTLIDAMNGRNGQVLATLDVVAFYATSHIVPTCAMHVQRSDDGHDYKPYAPITSCSCYYDLQATGQTSCTPCKKDSDCAGAPGGATNCVNVFGLPPVGYCEPPGTSQ
jgi:ABC-type phosphate transport system substrate-binding protein